VQFFALLYFRVVRWRDIANGTDWGVLVLFGGGIALSGVLQDTGASLFLGRLLTGVIKGWPLLGLIAAVVAFVIFLTELSSNTAIAALFVPIFASVAGEMGVAPAQLILPLALAASCAFMMPVATPPNAIVFGTGKVAQRDMMRTGLVLNLVFVLLLTALAMALI
jgi:sodium-dependent dicarboxylate transporter 2/3/5